MEQNNHTNYNANEIQVLEGLGGGKAPPRHVYRFYGRAGDRTIWSKSWWITP